MTRQRGFTLIEVLVAGLVLGITASALFFVVGSLVAFALTPASDPKFRWVAIATGITYAVLAVLSAIDHWVRARG